MCVSVKLRVFSIEIDMNECLYSVNFRVNAYWDMIILLFYNPHSKMLCIVRVCVDINFFLILFIFLSCV